MSDNKIKSNDNVDNELDDLLENFLIEEDKEYKEDKENTEDKKNKENYNLNLLKNNFKEKKNKTKKKNFNIDSNNFNNLFTFLYLLIIFNIGFKNLLLCSSFYYAYSYTNKKTIINFTTVVYYYIFGLIPTVCMIIVFCIYALSLNWDFIKTFYDFTDYSFNKNLVDIKNGFNNSINHISNLNTFVIIKKKYKTIKKDFNVVLKKKYLNMFLLTLDKIIEFLFINLKYILTFLKEEIEFSIYNFFKRWEKKLLKNKKHIFNRKIDNIKIPNINGLNFDPNMKNDLGALINMMGEAKNMMKLVNEKSQ